LGGLLALVLIFGLILGGVAYFALRNFDPNMFRAEFEKELTSRTGARVELGDMKLRWSPQPQLQVSGLKLYHPKTLEEILRSDQLQVDADLPAVLQKRFKISQIVIRSPEIFLKRNPDGTWNWQALTSFVPPAPVAMSPASKSGWIPVAEPAETILNLPSQETGGLGQSWEFEMGKVLVRSGTVRWTDETVEPVFETQISGLEAEVHRVSASPVYDFKATASVLGSDRKNFEAEGDLDLGAHSLAFTLRYGPGTVRLQGHLDSFDKIPRFEGTLEADGLDMEPVTPASYKTKEYVSGRLNAKAQISFIGSTPDQVQRSLEGQGTVDIKEGALKNRNLVKEVFDRLSSVIDITSSLGAELPPELGEMLRDRDTPFQSLKVVFALREGIANVHEFSVLDSHYRFSGQGTFGLLDRRVDGAMQLLISSSFSAYLIKKIHEMQMLADREGRVMIPFRYTGVYPDAVVQPDVGYVGARLLQQGTDALINKGIEHLAKYLEKKAKK
jgi:hypothetical protein